MPLIVGRSPKLHCVPSICNGNWTSRPLSKSLTKQTSGASRSIQDNEDENDRFYESFTLLVSKCSRGLILYLLTLARCIF